MWNLSIAGKITVFKTLAISKIGHVALVKVIPISTPIFNSNLELNKIKKSGNPKIRQEDTLCKDYENDSLKNVAITLKVTIFASLFFL